MTGTRQPGLVAGAVLYAACALLDPMLPSAAPPAVIKPVEPQAGSDRFELEPVGTRHDGGV